MVVHYKNQGSKSSTFPLPIKLSVEDAITLLSTQKALFQKLPTVTGRIVSLGTQRTLREGVSHFRGTFSATLCFPNGVKKIVTAKCTESCIHSGGVEVTALATCQKRFHLGSSDTSWTLPKETILAALQEVARENNRTEQMVGEIETSDPRVLGSRIPDHNTMITIFTLAARITTPHKAAVVVRFQFDNSSACARSCRAVVLTKSPKPHKVVFAGVFPKHAPLPQNMRTIRTETKRHNSGPFRFGDGLSDETHVIAVQNEQAPKHESQLEVVLTRDAETIGCKRRRISTTGNIVLQLREARANVARLERMIQDDRNGL